MLQKLVSPSVLSADFLNLETDLRNIEEAGADWHHLDIMDGHFVPNLTFGPPLVKQIKTIAKCPLDVHLMISNPDESYKQYIDAGADYLTFHKEACKDPLALIKKIQRYGAKAGISIKPKTPVQALDEILKYVDLVLIMSVEPGFGGQKFIESSLEKVAQLKNKIQQVKPDIIISVDGGVNAQNAKSLYDSGASCLVAGSFVYGAFDKKRALQSLK